jgi:rhamnose utilization protein RhaD (predicted bifunctional aldolase and dehydrogenase)
MSTKDTPLTYVKYLWNDAEARALDGLDRLVYRSNKLGEDLTLTNTGGGNTSSKLMETDPLNGDKVEVLWVKGSGGDLRTAKRDGFASLYLDKVRAMKPLYTGAGTRGPKTPIEDAMYPMYSHCVFSLNPRACSIDTPLHTFVPYQHVDHLHPNAVIAIAASVNQERLCTEIYGDELIYVPWQRPGFDIGLMIEDLIATNPGAKGVLLGHHGMSSWSNDDKTCYETALEIIDRATAYIEQHDRRPEVHAARRRSSPRDPGRDHPGPSRPDLHEPPVRRHGSRRREDAAVREQRGRAAAGRARDVVPRSLPPYEDQAAVRGLEPGVR